MTTQHASATPDLPLDMIIFGGTGDLSFRKLLPALYMAHLHCNLPPETRILTIGRKPWSREEYINEFMELKAKPFIEKKAFDAAAWDKFLALFVDDEAGARHEAGDFIQAGVDWARVGGIAAVVGNAALLPADQAIVFKSVGCAAWDLAACRVAREALSGG